MIFSPRFSVTLSFLLFIPSSLSYHWPSPKFDAIEALLYEDAPEPPDSVSLTRILNKCIPSSSNASTAAQWVRFAYHDMATHNVDDGSGGLDASLRFELGRPENVGNGMFITELELSDHPGKYITKSDIIAMAVVLAVAECKGPTIPFRMGRVDALQAGSPGVPTPDQDLASHTESFRRQGFTQSEMISLVACGHTFGGVHSPDFPEIVPSAVDGSDILIPFDTTPAVDNAIVTQYLDETTQNPLVANSNKTIISDFRIFNSDKNVTMKRLSSQKVFAQTCQELLGRMINTVPKGVKLSEVIEPLPVKVDAVQLSVVNNALRLKAMLRLSTANPQRRVTMFWENRTGGKCKPNDCSAPVVSTDDTTTELTRRRGWSPLKYRFDTPINATTSISKFWFEVDEGDGQIPIILNNGGTGYQIAQDRVQFDTLRSTVTFDPEVGRIFNIVVAVRNDVLPSHVYANVMWRITTVVKDQTFDFQPAPEFSSTAGFDFYKISVTGQRFMFDLLSVVNGQVYSEDARNGLNANTYKRPSATQGSMNPIYRHDEPSRTDGPFYNP